MLRTYINGYQEVSGDVEQDDMRGCQIVDPVPNTATRPLSPTMPSSPCSATRGLGYTDGRVTAGPTSEFEISLDRTGSVRLQFSMLSSKIRATSCPTRRAPSPKAAHVFVPDVRTRPFGSSLSFFTRPGKIKRRSQGTPQLAPASDFFRRRHRFHSARCRLEWMENAYYALCTRS